MDPVRRRRLLSAMVALVAAPIARAQQPAKVARIGYLTITTSESGAANFKALVAGLEALGWSAGRNLAIDVRYAGNKAADVPHLAAELVQLRPDVLVSVGPAPTLAVKQLGTRIPVVFVSVGDPVGLGLAKSLGRPEGNFTGLATLAPEFILAKQIELLRETVPRASRIAFLTNPGNPLHAQGRELRLRVARSQGLEVVEVEAATREALEPAFAEAARKKAEIMYLSGDPVPLANTEYVAELALRHRLPVMFLFHQHVEAGGLMSYGVDLADLFRRAASYVDRILKGAEPRDLPIEEPTRYMLVINMTTARALGLPIPQSVLLRAERVIE
jgi:putative tryptophan/tyrosine transport system substrate-binding protein